MEGIAPRMIAQMRDLKQNGATRENRTLGLTLTKGALYH